MTKGLEVYVKVMDNYLGDNNINYNMKKALVENIHLYDNSMEFLLDKALSCRSFNSFEKLVKALSITQFEIEKQLDKVRPLLIEDADE